MIPLHKVLIAEDALEKSKPTLYSGMITEAGRVKDFEAALSAYFDTPVLAVNSCTSGIDLALHLCGVGPGDEVVSTPMTCAATNTHVVLRGASLVWADIEKDTGMLSHENIIQRLSHRTKAIIVVDWGGTPYDCYPLRCSIPRGIPIIQDAAHSFGAKFEHGGAAHRSCTENSITQNADYTVWSFQAIKHLTTGDGGALKVPPDQFERAKRLRWFGIDRDAKVKFRFLQDIPEAGYKYHMNDLTASLGLANLPVAIKAVDQHRQNASELREHLKDLKHVRLAPPSTGSSWWFFSVFTKDWISFVDFAAERGVQAGPVHGRNDRYSAFGSAPYELPGVDWYEAHHVAVPCGWWLSKSDISTVAKAVKAWDRQL